MTQDNHQQRHPDGTFGPTTHLPADVDLGRDQANDATFSEATTTHDQSRLDQLVSHSDRAVRLATTANPHLTGEHIERLACDDDWQVRWQVAQLPYKGVGDLLVDDDDPVVRDAVLQHHGDELSVSDRERLIRDPARRRIATELANW